MSHIKLKDFLDPQVENVEFYHLATLNAFVAITVREENIQFVEQTVWHTTTIVICTDKHA